MSSSSSSSGTSDDKQSRDAGNWAQDVSTLRVSHVPNGALNLNVEGRRVVGPLQGFGKLWQKTYRIALRGAQVTPAEVVQVWKENLPNFQPPQNRFFPAVGGVEPGEIVLINAKSQGIRFSTGVMVLYADDESFTLMTPQGHPESGWVTFSAFPMAEENGCTIAQIQSMARANDPVFELGFRIFGSKQQEEIWRYVLTQLAAYFQVETSVALEKICLDSKLQWSQAGNIRHNAFMRTVLTTPTRWFRRSNRRPAAEP